MKRRTLWILGCVLALHAAPALEAQQRESPQGWAPEIEAFEQEDAAHPMAPGGVVFVGSSSIRFWDTLAEDFPTLNVLNRGFGGSQLSDVRYWLDELVIKHRPALVVLYAGENDIAFGRSPEQIFEDYKAIIDEIGQKLPGTPVAWVSIKPSPSRWDDREAMQRTNRMVMGYVADHPGLQYIDVWMPMLNAHGEPIPDIFVQDRLHMNPTGYDIWQQEIDPYVRGYATGNH